MDISSLNNKIVIIPDRMKDSFIKLISNKLFNIKVITLSELKKLYYFDYDKEAIYYVCNKYNVVSDIAKKYIDSIYYIKDIESDKVKFLSDLKSDLESNLLLYKNDLFKTFFNNRDIVLVDGEYYDKFYLNIVSSLNALSVTNYSVYNYNSKKKLYKCSNKNEEVELLASNICNLIKSGIDINKIKIANVSEDYYYDIRKVFRLFNIPVNLENNNSVNGIELINVFKNNYSSNIEDTLNKVFEYVKTEEDSDVYKRIVNIVNSYCFIDDYNKVRDLIFDDISRIKVRSEIIEPAVNVCDILYDIIGDDEYVFLINYNEDVIPVNYKDEDYLSDKIKSLLGISESFDLNKKINSMLQNRIRSIKNLSVSYSSFDLNNELYISSSYDEDMFEESDFEISYNHSNKFNKIKLVSLKDDFNKYGSVNNSLLVLNSNYIKEEYLSYSNKYSLINSDELYNYLSNRLVLSYTSLNSYNECAFKYYLKYVLKLDKYEDSFDACIGNIFHHILSLCFENDFDFEKCWSNEISSLKYVLNNSEKFFLEKLKNDLLLVIETIKNQLNYTSLKKIMYEKEIFIKINDDLHVSFKGFVDKIMYDEIEGFNIAVIIDYKTGNPNININNSIYGLDMQLPIYVYLIKKSNLLSNVKIGGFYLQKIVNNETDPDKKAESLKLQGYSNSDTDILKYVDSSYENSKIIKSLKVGNNGFYNYSKVISDEEIDKLSLIVENNINESYKNILDARFDINPKMINNENKGCSYCKYKDICYMRNEDIVNLESKSNIFGGELDD